ncbi:MAG: UDP-N-acetylglucosamine--N-acetylmuramyl-(pentapeptide) pyrophosphoryl-undecaprenol N-acetylglucosamine transferase [Candidatus Paceibacterota bacterium]|jgi:UDP-N-acetylglucosamine--N-acetylmuramyl-(pentapeptide) pyrophosphoryl-undecaprenol N-acetylglucosamine transferase
MRVLFAGEPTKGHLYPIIAVIEKLREEAEKNSEDAEFMLISVKSDVLGDIFEEAKVPYKVILAPISTKPNPLGSLMMPVGFFQALWYLFNYMPDVIFTKGGYVSIPVAMAAWILRIPIMIHESDYDPQPVDKFLARFAKRIAISFERTSEVYKSPKKVVFTGNPVLSVISGGNREAARKEFVLSEGKPTILILAGTLGAKLINDLVIEVLPQLLEKYQIIHQCGIDNYDKIRALVEKMNIHNLNDYHLFPFFRNRAANAYAACDLVISRAGANTVSEIMTVGKPCILIPLSTAVSDEQTKNAFFYSETGAAILVSEKNLKPNLLLSIIAEVFTSSLKALEMERAARKMAHPAAAEKIVQELMDISK